MSQTVGISTFIEGGFYMSGRTNEVGLKVLTLLVNQNTKYAS